MRLTDSIRLAAGSLRTNFRRTLLIALATAIGVSSVLVLTAFGEGARFFIVGQFDALGTDLLIVLPGRSETVGGPPPMMGETPRDLTIADALAIASHPAIGRVVPVMIGSAPVSTAAGLEREVTIIGSTAELAQIRSLTLAQGRFLPAMDPSRSAQLCVLGHTVARELFGLHRAYGQWVRIDGSRFRVVGVLTDSGVSVGVDFDEMVIIPVASAQALFNDESLFRILAEARNPSALVRATAAIHETIETRHEGENDVTVITQDSVVQTLGRILNALTLGIAGICAVSLAVAGVLIMNVMLVSVTQRRAEIGLLKAIGAQSWDIRQLFLLEAVMLASLGAALGLVVGLVGVRTIAAVVPTFPIETPVWALLASVVTAISAGLLFGVMPARRAALLEPIEALSRR